MFRHLTCFRLTVALHAAWSRAKFQSAEQELRHHQSGRRSARRQRRGRSKGGPAALPRALASRPTVKLKETVKIKTKANDPANLSILTEAFGIKLVVAKYDSDDAPAKIIDFYRDKLKKYGKVLECHSAKHGGDVEVTSIAKTLTKVKN